MKDRSKILLLFLAFTLLFTLCRKDPEIDPLAPVDIPDPNFLAALIAEGVDTNGDGIINHQEAEAVIGLNVYARRISDLTGIEKFLNLDTLRCGGNEFASLDLSENRELGWLSCGHNPYLTSLDVSGCVELLALSCSYSSLTSLDFSQNVELLMLECADIELSDLDVSVNIHLFALQCSGNELKALDVSNNTALKYLHCFENQLTSLDVSSCTALETLGCNGNQLTSLDVANNAALTELYCFENQLTSLDVSNNTALEWLYCFENQLTSLDVSGRAALKYLHCNDSQLTSLDVSGCTALRDLYCFENQLISLDVSINTELEILDLRYMPTLTEVCVWTMPFPPEGVDVDTIGSPNVYFTTACSK